MNQFIIGALFGAGFALLFAPTTGRSVRAKLRDQFAHLEHEAERLGEFAQKKQQHLTNKAIGLQHEACKIGEKASETLKELSPALQSGMESVKKAAQQAKDLAKENIKKGDNFKGASSTFSEAHQESQKQEDSSGQEKKSDFSVPPSQTGPNSILPS